MTINCKIYLLFVTELTAYTDTVWLPQNKVLIFFIETKETMWELFQTNLSFFTFTSEKDKISQIH